MTKKVDHLAYLTLSPEAAYAERRRRLQKSFDRHLANGDWTAPNYERGLQAMEILVDVCATTERLACAEEIDALAALSTGSARSALVRAAEMLRSRGIACGISNPRDPRDD